MFKLQNLLPLHLLHSVIPAKAGIHFELKLASPIKSWARKWIPAFAGMTA